MQCIASLIERPPLIGSDASLQGAAALLAANPAAPALAVADDGLICGLITRTAIDWAQTAGLSAATVQDLMQADPPSLRADCGAAEAAALILSGAPGRDAFVCLDQGAYAGVGDLRSLLPALLLEPAAPDRRTAGFLRLVHAAQGDFRAHMQGLMAMAGRLSHAPLRPDDRAQVLGIQAAGESLMRLAGDVLDMAPLGQGGPTFDPQPQPVRDLMDALQARWASRAADAGVSLLVAYDGEADLVALIDGPRLAQVFDALVENALRYTRHGSVEATLSARAQDGRLMLEGRVRDTGPGLAADRLARIFDSDGTGDQDAGMPLALSRCIVESMRGSIRAESNVGQGMTVGFGLMADAALREDAAPQAGHVNGAPHVLVVDDNATNRMVAEALCEMFDCTCETANDGVEAVEAARSGRFDVILMDIKMPRMDGVAATRAIRDLGGAAGAAPIVALTANADPEDARSYLAAGMCGVVEKPIKPDRLLQAINSALAAAPAVEPRIIAA